MVTGISGQHIGPIFKVKQSRPTMKCYMIFFESRKIDR